MAKDMPDHDLRFVLLGTVDDQGRVDLALPVRRFPKTYREKEFYRLPFLSEGKSLPDGFLIRSFLGEHFIKGSQYIEELFSVPCVNLDPRKVLAEVKS